MFPPQGKHCLAEPAGYLHSSLNSQQALSHCLSLATLGRIRQVSFETQDATSSLPRFGDGFLSVGYVRTRRIETGTMLTLW